MTRVKGPFVSEKVDDEYSYNLENTVTKLYANGTRRTRDARKQFIITLSDAMLQDLGATLGLNTSFSDVEVLGTTVGEAVRLVNATLETGVPVVEAVSMRGVVEAGSVEQTLSLGMVRRLRFEDAVEDGDLLLLTPGRLDEEAKETSDSMTVSVSVHDSTRLSAPIGEEGNCVASSDYISLAFIFLLFVGLLAALLSNRELVKRVRTWIDEQRRKREALLGAVRFHAADNESVKF